jgi:hypothetical protein
MAYIFVLQRRQGDHLPLTVEGPHRSPVLGLVPVRIREPVTLDGPRAPSNAARSMSNTVSPVELRDKDHVRRPVEARQRHA